jgi:hypothetical protein
MPMFVYRPQRQCLGSLHRQDPFKALKGHVLRPKATQKKNVLSVSLSLWRKAG